MTDEEWPRKTEAVLAGWSVTTWWAPVDGRLEVVGVDLRSFVVDDDGAGPLEQGYQPVTKRLLVGLPWQRLVDEGRRNLRWGAKYRAGKATSKAQQRRELEAVRLAAAAARPKGRGGRPPTYSDEHYARVAQVYREALTDPVLAVQAALDPDGPDRARAASWVRQARRRGLLEAAPRRQSSRQRAETMRGEQG